MRKLIPLLILFAGFVACKKDQYYLYNDVKRLQFGPAIDKIYTANQNLADTLKLQTFYYKNATDLLDTVYFDLYAIGGTDTKARPFSLVQEELPNVDNAVSGIHYVAFDDEKIKEHYIIKAGTVHTRVPIFIKRDASMKTKTFKLKLKVVENGDFLLGEVANLWRKVEMTDRLTRPSAWTDTYVRYYFGVYSVKKHEFMIQYTGQKWDTEYINELDPPVQEYYIAELKKQLIKIKDENGGKPLLDENNEEITFP